MNIKLNQEQIFLLQEIIHNFITLHPESTYNNQKTYQLIRILNNALIDCYELGYVGAILDNTYCD